MRLASCSDTVVAPWVDTPPPSLREIRPWPVSVRSLACSQTPPPATLLFLSIVPPRTTVPAQAWTPPPWSVAWFPVTELVASTVRTGSGSPL
jgi:hypothetical protein